MAVASCFCGGLAHANPTSPTVVSGSASFATSGSTLTVTNSPSAIINWQSFGIGSGETVRFIQQSAASSVLNRVTGGNISQILGTLQSNGRVFLINTAGIVFGQGATVDVGGLVASTLNMTNDDFLAGNMRFNADTAAPGEVLNEGNIRTPNGGFVWLLAPDVKNSGLINTPSGEAVLAAGHSIELVDSTNPDQRVMVSAQSQDVNLSQLMAANDGNIFSVLNSGTISANTAVVGEEGRIYLKSAGKVLTTAISVVEAHGDIASDGGRILAFAQEDGLYEGIFDVSGRSGGFVETSGSYVEINQAQVKTNALNAEGVAGMWLIDPLEILISSSSCPSGITCITPSTIFNALNAGNFSIVTNDGSITVDDAVISPAGTNDLSLVAANNIEVTSDGFMELYGGDLSMTAGNNIIVTGTLNANSIYSSAGQTTFVDGSLDAINDIAISSSAFNTLSATLSAGDLISINAGTINVSTGSNILADYIGLNSLNFQVDSPSFFNDASNANITIFASTLNASVGLSFLGGNVSITNSSDVLGGSVLHGVAQGYLTVEDSTLGQASSIRLEVGKHLTISNNALVSAQNINTLYFDFPLLGANGWTLDGILNAVSGLNGSQIQVAGVPGILGNGFIVNYSSPFLTSLVHQSFGQTLQSTGGPGVLPPETPPDFFESDPNPGATSQCTGTATSNISCGPAGTGIVVGGNPPPGRTQEKEPQECR